MRMEESPGSDSYEAAPASSAARATRGTSGEEPVPVTPASATVAPKEEMERQHKELATDMFKKITEYLNGELASN